MLEDSEQSRHPICAVGKDEVAHDAEWSPSVGTFILLDPEIWQPAQERIHRGWRASKDRKGAVKSESFGGLHTLKDARRNASDSEKFAEAAGHQSRLIYPAIARNPPFVS